VIEDHLGYPRLGLAPSNERFGMSSNFSQQIWKMKLSYVTDEFTLREEGEQRTPLSKRNFDTVHI
jgi:hypothetical protein